VRKKETNRKGKENKGKKGDKGRQIQKKTNEIGENTGKTKK
jgi:hypothetical protein